MVNIQAKINTTLQVCGFTVDVQKTFILTTEGLDSWVAFTSIEYDDFASFLNNASPHTSFSLGVLKQKRLSALKFWIGDAIRINELPHTAVVFTQQILVVYIELYNAFVKAKHQVGFVDKSRSLLLLRFIRCLIYRDQFCNE